MLYDLLLKICRGGMMWIAICCCFGSSSITSAQKDSLLSPGVASPNKGFLFDLKGHNE